MASEPYFDKAKGRWRMKWWAGLAAGWKIVTLCPHPGAWSKERPPKRPPAEVDLLARKYRDLEIQARHGVNVAPVRGHPLKGYLDSYRDRFARSKAAGSLPTLDRAIRLFLDHCAGAKVATIEAVTTKTCRDYLHWRHETIGHATMKAEKGLLSKAWTDARLDGMIAVNPWVAAKVPGSAKVDPPPYWTRSELQKLVAGCKLGWLRDLIQVGANTGLRITALLSLEWRDVSFERSTLRVRAAIDKAGRGYQLPLNVTATDVLLKRHAARREDSQLVFPSPRAHRKMRSQMPYDRMAKLVKRLGLPDYGSYNHILRHTFASHSVMAGVPLLTVSSWLGHSSIKMTEKYAHVIPSESHRQMERFDLPAAPAAGGTPPPPAIGQSSDDD